MLYSDESSVALLDVTIGKEVSRYTGYQRISNFSLGSQLMAICGVDGNVDLFDVKNFPRLKVSTISTKVPLMSTDISSDDILMVCGSDDISVKKKTKVGGFYCFIRIFLTYSSSENEAKQYRSRSIRRQRWLRLGCIISSHFRYESHN